MVPRYLVWVVSEDKQPKELPLPLLETDLEGVMPSELACIRG